LKGAAGVAAGSVIILTSRGPVKLGTPVPGVTGAEEGFYVEGRRLVLDGDINFGQDELRAALVHEDYVFDPEHSYRKLKSYIVRDQPLADVEIIGMASIGASTATFRAVSGPTVGGIAYYVPGFFRNRLLCYQGHSVGMPLSPNGGDIQVSWGESGIFSL
jgi:hypothetical protein